VNADTGLCWLRQADTDARHKGPPVALANMDLKNAEKDMKSSDYQNLRNAVSDLEFFGVFSEEESKVYQRRLEDLWHQAHQKKQSVTQNGQATAIDVQEQEELAKTIQKDPGVEESSKGHAPVDIRGPGERRSVTNKARLVQLVKRVTGKRRR
jgi:hypothetical protein